MIELLEFICPCGERYIEEVETIPSSIAITIHCDECDQLMVYVKHVENDDVTWKRQERIKE